DGHAPKECGSSQAIKALTGQRLGVSPWEAHISADKEPSKAERLTETTLAASLGPYLRPKGTYRLRSPPSILQSKLQRFSNYRSYEIINGRPCHPYRAQNLL
ncbi:3864_t:CDS:2, partial [Dentiscutata heterogama]